jgi:hypothetical protein
VHCIQIFALGAPLTASAASLKDYAQCCSYYATSVYNQFAINENVKFWGDYSQHKCYEVPDGNSQSSPGTHRPSCVDFRCVFTRDSLVISDFEITQHGLS